MAYSDTKVQDFLAEMQDVCDMLKAFRAKANSLTQAYYANAYQSGGDNAIVDQTTGTYQGVTAVEIGNVVTSIAGFETWVDVGHDENCAVMSRLAKKTWR